MTTITRLVSLSFTVFLVLALSLFCVLFAAGIGVLIQGATNPANAVVYVVFFGVCAATAATCLYSWLSA